MSDFLGFLGGLLLCAFIFLVVVMGGILWVGNMAALQTELAQIEQLRVDASDVDPQQAEDVIGQVVERNLFIRDMQVGNTQWWIGWAIPDEWDSVELIEVPSQ